MWRGASPACRGKKPTRRLRIKTLAKAILSVDLDTYSDSLHLVERYALSFFDALMLAAALQGGSAIFWSEDMQHGTVIEDRLRIVNPFI